MAETGKSSPTGQAGHSAETLAPETLRWQRRLLPLMVRMIVSLTLFFFLASLAQLVFLHWSIIKAPELQLDTARISAAASAKADFDQLLAAAKLNALIELEGQALQRHYHQANVLLMARLWIRYLGFVTGMILSLVGAVFILGKLQVSTSELAAKVEGAELSFKSASPGLILAILGVALMLTTILTHHRIETTDNAVYLREYSIAPTSKTIAQPPLNPPSVSSARKGKD